MTEAIETQQKKIEQAEAEYKHSLYQNGLRSFKIFPAFSVDTK